MAGKTQNKSRVLLEFACPPAWKTAGDVTEWAVVLHVHESINEDFLGMRTSTSHLQAGPFG